MQSCFNTIPDNCGLNAVYSSWHPVQNKEQKGRRKLYNKDGRNGFSGAGQHTVDVNPYESNAASSLSLLLGLPPKKLSRLLAQKANTDLALASFIRN